MKYPSPFSFLTHILTSSFSFAVILFLKKIKKMLDVIKQLWVDTRNYTGGKLEFLADIYSLLTIGQSIIFVETKRAADMVHQILSSSGYTCSVLHGGVEPSERDVTMEAFRNGESNVLITTNVLARGVDIDNVCLVVNYDPPTDKDGRPDFETYLHRIGRTGRFGRKGTAINLIDDQKSLEILAAIEQYYAKDGKEMIHQAEPDPEKLAEVIEI
jgi:ATP-dependent RNA helicase DDX19/DBP5